MNRGEEVLYCQVRVFPPAILNERMLFWSNVLFHVCVKVEGNDLVSSLVYKYPLSQEVEVWCIAQEGGMTV